MALAPINENDLLHEESLQRIRNSCEGQILHFSTALFIIFTALIHQKNFKLFCAVGTRGMMSNRTYEWKIREFSK